MSPLLCGLTSYSPRHRTKDTGRKTYGLAIVQLHKDNSITQCLVQEGWWIQEWTPSLWLYTPSGLTNWNLILHPCWSSLECVGGRGGEWEGHAGDSPYPCMTLRQSGNVKKWQTNKLLSVQILKKESLPQLVQISLQLCKKCQGWRQNSITSI